MGKRLVNEFAWSLSRDAVAERCMREYWYAYFCAWGGWERKASEESRTAYHVKKLDNRWSLPGKVAHAAIDRWVLSFRSGAPISNAHIIEGALEELRNHYRASKRGDYMHSKAPGFIEHYLEQSVAKSEWVEMGAKLEEGMRNFFADFAIGLAPKLGSLLRFEKFSKLDVEGTPVFAVPDFVLGDVTDFLDALALVIDWKFGRPRDSHVDQLVLYTMFVSQRTGIPEEKIAGVDRYLTEGSSKTIMPGWDGFATKREELVTRIKSRHEQIKSLMDGPETAPREAFPLTSDEKHCVSCRFRRLCKPNFTESAATTTDAALYQDDELGE